MSDVQCFDVCSVVRTKSRLLVPRREDIRFSETCLIDSLRALGVRIPYERNGPFWALRDGGEFLKPQKRGLVADPAVPGDTWAPGKYVVFVEALSHFYGVEVFADGEALMYTSCRRHEGQTVDPERLSMVRVDARYRVVQDDEGADDSDEDSVRTLSSYEDFAERRFLEPLAWSTYQIETATWFLAFSRLDGSALRAGPLNTQQAAAWFLHVHAQGARPGCLQEAFAALPWQVRAAVLESPVTRSVCPLPQHAVLHMQGVLARAGCELSSNIFCCSRTVSSLYGFVWPKASLKEGLLRLGHDVRVQYQRVQTPAAFNTQSYACGIVLASWLPAQAWQKGQSCTRGDVEIADCYLVGHWDGQQWQPPKQEENYLWSEENKGKHCMEDSRTVTYKDAYAWVLQNARKYQEPVPFQRPLGCVTWVTLARSTSAKNRGAAGEGSRRTKTGKKGFVGVLQATVALPEQAQEWLGRKCSVVETLADGACGLHATFGETSEAGVLVCNNARELALHALEGAFNSEDAEAMRIKSTLWQEMACRGMREEQAYPEAKTFWCTFAEKFPDAVLEAKQAAAAEADLSVQLSACRDSLTRACRAFFLQASPNLLHDFCRGITYTAEGQEPCFQMQGGRCIVKGTQMELPADGPRTKLEAIRSESQVFDALRVAALLSADEDVVVSVLEHLSQEDENAASVALALQELRCAAARTSTEPSDFKRHAVAAYLAAIQKSAYYFSVEELKVI
ncbi:RPL15, partial [Symbiodinium sp. CCMP2456]